MARQCRQLSACFYHLLLLLLSSSNAAAAAPHKHGQATAIQLRPLVYTEHEPTAFIYLVYTLYVHTTQQKQAAKLPFISMAWPLKINKSKDKSIEGWGPAIHFNDNSPSDCHKLTTKQRGFTNMELVICVPNQSYS